ncbi:MAG TPA: CPBP family intramembrane metalloprotease [Phycisphaerae bacterium]|nr:CPBP family intramembrane metalloprotease [Phycisphaerae bacterium]HOI54149.1 CPBP family intramembrane metalloprotease [Phycisphaerae bacterium]
MPLTELLDPEILAYAVSLLLAIGGLPLLVATLRRLRTQGLGLPETGAWPAVGWGREQGGLLFVLIVFVLQNALHMAFGGLTAWLTGPEGHLPLSPGGRMATLSLVTVAHWIVACGLVLGWLIATGRARAETFGLTPRRLLRSAGRGAVLLLAAEPLIIATLLAGAALHAWIVEEPPPVHPVLQSLGEHPQAMHIVVLFLTAGVLIPFFEELFFRGILQTTLMRLGNATAAITIASVLFGLVHMGVPTSVLPLTIFGWAMGYAFYRTGNLASCVVMHSVFNLMSLSMALLPHMAGRTP